MIGAPEGTTLNLHEPTTFNVAWRSPVRRSSEIHELTTEEMTAGDDPKPDGIVN